MTYRQQYENIDYIDQFAHTAANFKSNRYLIEETGGNVSARWTLLPCGNISWTCPPRETVQVDVKSWILFVEKPWQKHSEL